MTVEKIFYWTLIFTVSGFFVFSLLILSPSLDLGFRNTDYLFTYSNKVPVEEPEETKISMAFVGDIMMDRGVRNVTYIHGKGDYGYITRDLGFLEDFDVVFGNLEGPISDEGPDLGGAYSFGMEPAVSAVLKETGFSVLSVANNHSWHRGREGFENTLYNLSSNGIDYTGGGRNLNEALKPIVIETGDLLIGFLGFSDFGSTWLEAGDTEAGILIAGSDYHDRAIMEASSEVDVLVVSYHFGEEYIKEPNDRQRYLAHRAIDLGADVIVGHHPHVIQPVEEYRGGIIAYSLGNFIFDQYFSKETMEGLVLIVDIEGGSASFSTERVELSDHFQPRLVE